MKSVKPDPRSLLETARSVRPKAYAPYSNYQVGAAVLMSDGRIFSGVNVENASYGLTMCAERVAVFAAIVAGGREVEAIAIVAAGHHLPWPCGACRQVLAEFGSDHTRVFVAAEDDLGNYQEATLFDLIPHAFGPSHLAG